VHVPAGRVAIRIYRTSRVRAHHPLGGLMIVSTVSPTTHTGDVQTPARLLARALVRSLTRGTAISQGVRYIHVGHDQWLVAQHELLEEVGDDGHSETKFVRGAYGAGKSHFLSVVQDRAREAGWMTSHIECKVDKVQ